MVNENSSIDVPNPNSFNDLSNVFTHPPQPQYKSYSCELCGNDSHYGGPHESFQCQPMNQNNFEHNSNYSGFDQPSQYSIDHQEDLNQQRNDVHDRWDKMIEPSRRFNSFYDDDDYEESTIPLNETISQIPLSNAITSVLPTMEPEDSLSMGDEHLSTIPENESDEFIKSSVEDLVLIPSESEDTSGSDCECDLPSYDDFSPINIPEEKSVTFS
ncbi:hypothetical protein Tco_1225389, partial [Tanacetum coccineum]